MYKKIKIQQSTFNFTVKKLYRDDLFVTHTLNYIRLNMISKFENKPKRCFGTPFSFIITWTAVGLQ